LISVRKKAKVAILGKVNSKILLGYFLFATFVVSRIVLFYVFPLQLKNGKEVNIETTILSEPRVKGNYQYFNARTGNFWQSSLIQIKTRAVPEFSYGDTLQISGKVSRQDYTSRQSKTSVWVVLYPKIKARTQGILPIFAGVRQYAINFCQHSFSSQYSGLLLGILFGIKNGVSYSTAQALSNTGLSHLLVIDGMKITLFIGFVIAFTGAIFERRLALIISILCVIGYMILSGLEISAIRAGVMGIAALSAKLWGRQYTGIHTLLLTGGLLLLWDPLLIENVGFQLSVLATGGIILIKPLIPLKGIFLDDISITIAAQIATLPILLATFGNYGLLSVPVHALVLWVIPPIMIISAAAIVISFIFQPLGVIVAQLSLPLLWYFRTVAMYFGKLNWSLQITYFPIVFTVAYYMLLIAGILFFNTRSKTEYEP